MKNLCSVADALDALRVPILRVEAANLLRLYRTGYHGLHGVDRHIIKDFGGYQLIESTGYDADSIFLWTREVENESHDTF